MKRGTAFLMAVILFLTVWMPGNTLQVQAASHEEILTGLQEKALDWIAGSVNENGSFGDDRIPKDSCLVVEVFHDIGAEVDTTWLENYEMNTPDNDSASRLYCALGSENYFNLISKPNTDGGYGLTGIYQSDILDTRLVFEAMVRRYIKDGSCGEQIDGILQYLASVQNGDGGFSYLPGMASDERLTLEIGMITAAYEKYGQITGGSNMLQKLDAYVAAGSFTIDEFETYACANIYRCLRGTIQDAKEMVPVLAELQESNGSIHNSPDDTIVAVRLAWALQEYLKPYIVFEDLSLELSTYTLYVNHVNPVEVKAGVTYRCNTEYTGALRVTVLENEESILEKDLPCVFGESLTQFTLTDTLEIDVKEDAEYKIKAELIREGAVELVKEETLHATELVIEELQLTLNNSGSDGVKLSWNDISNLFYRYGYRIYRSQDGEEWETRSSWNGIEKVSVLNIYPNNASKNYLSDWMEKNVSSENTPAGKGLFEIDKVSIDDYNRSPDTYLKDENGYKYDVLVFGTYDCNGGKDLNEKSYEATRKFAESGRGILFGHDTVTANNVVNHPVFARFADDLGIKLTWDGQYKATNTVKVVNSGFLTSYPWKLSGVLTIPTAHALGQFTGGSNTATVWMEFNVNNRVDKETEGRDNAYLCTKNQLALIQTGHSSGQATDDERKVLANTMFYLKQLTNATETVDKSAADMEQPGLCEVSNVQRNEEGITLEVGAEDFGTKYYYYVEAVPQSMEEELRRESQTAETVVLSGIQGYQIAVNTSQEPCEEAAFGEVLYTEDNSLSIPEELLGEGTHLHIRAVDNHGNAGEETLIILPEKEDRAWLHTGYSLFGSQGVTAYCSTLHTAGDVYSGLDITFGGSNIVVNGACNAVGRINAYVGSAHMAGQNDGCEPCSMPDYEESIRKLVSGCESVNTLNVYNSRQMEEAVYCKQMVCAYCPEFILKDSMVCEGNINLGVNKGVFGSEKPIAVYSANGNISINASTFSGTGIIYAPNGTVTINVAELDYSGSIIAKQIILQGSVLQVNEVAE